MSQQKPPSKQQQILDGVTQLRTAMVGIPGTADQGLVGEVREMRATVGKHSEAIARLCALQEGEEGMSRKKKLGILGGIGGILAGLVVGLFKAFARGNNGG